MIKRFEIHQQENSDGYIDYQIVRDEKGKVEFAVWNAGEFDASDWLNAVKYGMELAKQGYDEIEYVTIEDEEDE